MKIERNLLFADGICDTRSCKIKNVFFNQVNLLVDWKPLSNLINKHYSRVLVPLGSLRMMDFYYSK